ncbi:MAG: hypothetical protein AAF443_06395 [Chlamydiota bacterium]
MDKLASLLHGEREGLVSRFDRTRSSDLKRAYHEIKELYEDKKEVNKVMKKLAHAVEEFENDPDKSSIDLREIAPVLHGLSINYESLPAYYHDHSLSSLPTEKITGQHLFDAWSEINESLKEENQNKYDEARGAQLTLVFFSALEKCQQENTAAFDDFIKKCTTNMYPASIDELFTRKNSTNDTQSNSTIWHSIFSKSSELDNILNFCKTSSKPISKCAEWTAERFEYKRKITTALEKFKNDPHSGEESDRADFHKLALLMDEIKTNDPAAFDSLINEVGLSPSDIQPSATE